MAKKPTCEELKQRVKQLEKDARNHRAVESALKDYVSYQSVLAVLQRKQPVSGFSAYDLPRQSARHRLSRRIK